MDAQTTQYLVFAVVVAVLGLAVVFAVQARRGRRLREHFGPEYERLLRRYGQRRRKVHKVLEARLARRKRLDIQPLAEPSRERYIDSWEYAQSRFMDAPSLAVREADRLLIGVLRERGYPVNDFEQSAADLSVDHPDLVQDYRAAHAMTVRTDDGADTEYVRRAMLHYRAIFAQLLQPAAGR